MELSLLEFRVPAGIFVVHLSPLLANDPPSSEGPPIKLGQRTEGKSRQAVKSDWPVGVRQWTAVGGGYADFRDHGLISYAAVPVPWGYGEEEHLRSDR